MKKIFLLYTLPFPDVNDGSRTLKEFCRLPVSTPESALKRRKKAYALAKDEVIPLDTRRPAPLKNFRMEAACECFSELNFNWKLDIEASLTCPRPIRFLFRLLLHPSVNFKKSKSLHQFGGSFQRYNFQLIDIFLISITVNFGPRPLAFLLFGNNFNSGAFHVFFRDTNYSVFKINRIFI